MQPEPLEQVVRNVDARLTRVEQILPTLATKAELKEAVAPLATRDEMHAAIAEAVAPLATKAELAKAVAPLATRAEMHTAIAEEGERTRRHFDVVAERLEGHIKLLAEGHAALRDDVRDMRTEVKTDIAQLDRRVMRLEADRLKQTRSPET